MHPPNLTSNLDGNRAVTAVGRLERLLRPRSLVFVGGEAAELAIEASRSFGFGGEMWAVNPRRSLGGLPTFRSVGESPGPADAAFVGVGSHAAVEVVRDLAAAGTGAAVCHASGFAETGGPGAALQHDLAAAAAGMPLVGPNCYGTLCALNGAALWPDVHGLSRCDRGVALISQSGNIAVNLTMQRRGLDIAWTMALGNQADVGIAEACEALAADPAVTGLGLCIEALDDVERFAAAADSALRRGLPMAALKLGAAEASSAIALTHTASMAGDDAAYDALFRRLGVRRVHTVSELLDTLAIMGALGPLNGSRLISLSCSGGEAALVADRSRSRDLDFPPLAPDHAARVAEALDGRVTVTNPLDYHTFIWGDEQRLKDCFGAVLGVGGEPGRGCSPFCAVTLGADREPVPDMSPEHTTGPGDDGGRMRRSGPFDAAVLVLDFPAEGLDRSRWQPTLRAFASACAISHTPGVVVASMAENLPAEARARAAELGLACCGDLDNALSALEAGAAWGRHSAEREAPDQGEPNLPEAQPSGVGQRVGRKLPDLPLPLLASRGDPVAGRALSEYDAKRRLAEAGIATPDGMVVPASEAAAAAARLGCPVVVKITGAMHKSDVGGVVAGLDSPAEVSAAAEGLAVIGDGFVLVEEFVGDAVAELLVSVRSVPPVGMLLTVGAGGTLAELLDDTVTLLVPAGRPEVREALRSLRMWPLLAGHRGRPAGAVTAAVEAVCALGSLVRDDSSIVEAEINPLIVTPHSAVAADALMLASDFI